MLRIPCFRALDWIGVLCKLHRWKVLESKKIQKVLTDTFWEHHEWTMNEAFYWTPAEPLAASSYPKREVGCKCLLRRRCRTLFTKPIPNGVNKRIRANQSDMSKWLLMRNGAPLCKRSGDDFVIKAETATVRSQTRRKGHIWVYKPKVPISHCWTTCDSSDPPILMVPAYWIGPCGRGKTNKQLLINAAQWNKPLDKHVPNSKLRPLLWSRI